MFKYHETMLVGQDKVTLALVGHLLNFSRSQTGTKWKIYEAKILVEPLFPSQELSAKNNKTPAYWE